MKEIQNIQEEYENLLDQEASKYPNFVKDGIVDYETFNKQPLKILWILKEANNNNDNGDLRKYIQNPTIYRKWKASYLSILHVSCGLLSNINDFDSLKLDMDVFKKIALININKLGGGNRTNWREFIPKYQLFKDLIIQQMKLINPDVVIFGNVFWLMWNEMKNFHVNDDETEYKMNEIYKNKIKTHCNSHRIFIETYHPGQTNLTKKMYFEKTTQDFFSWWDKRN